MFFNIYYLKSLELFRNTECKYIILQMYICKNGKDKITDKRHNINKSYMNNKIN